MSPYTPTLPIRVPDASREIRALVERQARAWEQNDFALAASDWHPNGVLVSPTGRWHAAELPREMDFLHRHYTELTVTIKNVFSTADGCKLAVEWDWTVTRKADGARSTTPDAIIAELQSGKITSWREYFDLSSSLEGSP